MEKLDSYLIHELNNNSTKYYDLIIIFNETSKKIVEKYNYLSWMEITKEYYLVKSDIKDIRKLMLEPEIKRITVGSIMQIL